jgi:hypothetical protein
MDQKAPVEVVTVGYDLYYELFTICGINILAVVLVTICLKSVQWSRSYLGPYCLKPSQLFGDRTRFHEQAIEPRLTSYSDSCSPNSDTKKKIVLGSLDA